MNAPERKLALYRRVGVVAIHRHCNALARPAERGLGGALDSRVQRDTLVAARLAQQEIHVGVAPLRRAANADLDAREVVHAKLLDRGLQAMLSTRGAAPTDAHARQR